MGTWVLSATPGPGLEDVGRGGGDPLDGLQALMGPLTVAKAFCGCGEFWEDGGFCLAAASFSVS